MDTIKLKDDSFYVTGGTLRPDAPCYVARRADADLYDALRRGDYCYVLTARQMGKSSLMLHTAARLREEGVAVIILDLQAVGQNLSPEQWYDGLLSLVGQQLDCEEDLEEFWLAHPRLGPLQRWMAALREVVLARCPGRLILFIDEIDAIRALPFPVDEFFAGIRECYNRRTQDPEYSRLTFCLLGVAAPADLISDTRTSPFNIGRRIELTDFTEAEALPLAAGLVGDVATEGTGGTEEDARVLLQRVLYWTGGHPYLTQRLCRALAETGHSSSASSVPSVAKSPNRTIDALCDDLFFTRAAREADDNLAFVRNRLLRSELDLAALLDLYQQVRQGRRVVDDETNPLATLLRLSGVARSVGGVLQVRNRIYERVFDREWITAHMPDVELRRQRAAYRRGLLRAAGVSAVVLAVMGGLVLAAMQQARLARRATLGETQQRQRVQEQQETLRGQLYASQMNLVERALAVADQESALNLLNALRPSLAQKDLRGFEWRLLWRMAQEIPKGIRLHGTQGETSVIALSRDGRTMATGHGSGAVTLWTAGSWKERSILKGHRKPVTTLALTRDGRMLASGSEDGTVRLWDVAAGRELAVVTAQKEWVATVAFSPRASRFGRVRRALFVAGDDGHVGVWDLRRPRRPRLRERFVTGSGRRPFSSDGRPTFSPDGRLLCIADGKHLKMHWWDIATRRRIATIDCPNRVTYMAFSPAGELLATAEGQGNAVVRLWDLRTRKPVSAFVGHRGPIMGLAFSPDGRRLASGSWDSTIRLWDMETREQTHIFSGHTGTDTCLAFTPDGKTLVSNSADASVTLWKPGGQPGEFRTRHRAPWVRVAFSPRRARARTLAMMDSAGGIQLWEAATGRAIGRLVTGFGSGGHLAFSPDGRLLAAGEQSGKVWDVRTGRQVAHLEEKPKGRLDLWRKAPVAFSPDGALLAWGSTNVGGDNTVHLWSVATRREVARLPENPEWIGWLRFSSDGRLLAGLGHTLRLWARGADETWRQTACLRGYESWATPGAFSPDGRLLATGGGDQKVRVWDLATRKQIHLLTEIQGEIDWVGFSPDGTTLILSTNDGLQFWSTASWKRAVVLYIPRLSVYAVDMAPDGSALALGRTDGTLRLLRAASLEEADRQVEPPRVTTNSVDRRVTLQWERLAFAVGYNVYRRLAGADRPLVKLTLSPIPDASFTDTSPEIRTGQPVTYAVAPVIVRSEQRTVEAPTAMVSVTPVGAVPGWVGGSLQEGNHGGSSQVGRHPREIVVRGSGEDVWDKADGCYFMSRTVTGDFRATVTRLAGPGPLNSDRQVPVASETEVPAEGRRGESRSHEWAKAGLMLRESLNPGARNVFLFATPDHGVDWYWRPLSDSITEGTGAAGIPTPVDQPVVLRLTRRGNRISAEYSRDGGHRYRLLGDPLVFDDGLPPVLHVGLAITSHDPQRVSEARFRDLRIEPLGGGR